MFRPQPLDKSKPESPRHTHKKGFVILNVAQFVKDHAVRAGRPDEPFSIEDLAELIALLEHTECLVFVFDRDDRIRIANGAARRALHVPATDAPTWTEMMRRNYALNRGARIVTKNFEAWLTSTLSRRGKVPHRNIEIDLCDGRWLAMTETVLANGWMLCMAIDVTHLKASERSLRVDRDDAQKAAQTDELTGISNRRHIMALLDNMRLGHLATKCDGAHACLLDLDHFKSVNDTFGHQIGDDVLVAFARLLREKIGTRDSVGRVGGEEFLVLLTTRRAPEARGIIQGILDDLRAQPLLPHQPDLIVTASAGLTRMDGTMTSAAIYSKCDAALYAAKDAGRDRIVLQT